MYVRYQKPYLKLNMYIRKFKPVKLKLRISHNDQSRPFCLSNRDKVIHNHVTHHTISKNSNF